MAKGYPIGVHVVHRYLWSISDRRGMAKVDHPDLMDQFDCTKTTSSRLVRELVAQGRIRQVTKRRQRKGLFLVTDPDLFDADGVSEVETDEED